jgi:riboflavin synthase
MFTGIIQELGRVVSFDPHSEGARLKTSCRSVLTDAKIGASIAVNGACLTVVEMDDQGFTADLAPETLKKTNLGDLKPGAPVNLERPLAVSGRLDGHFVLGHVDGTADVTALDELGDDNWWLQIRVPKLLERYVVSKGSVALDGISLTVAALNNEIASFTIIPHTYQHTTLHSYKPGMRLNIEVDILAKHVEKLLAQAPISCAT